MVVVFKPRPTVFAALQEDTIMPFQASDVKLQTEGSLNVPGQNNIVIELEAKVAGSLVGAVKKTLSDAIQGELRKHMTDTRSFTVTGIDVRYSKVRGDGVVTEMQASFSIVEEIREASNDVDAVLKELGGV
jgi:hypothetical protein